MAMSFGDVGNMKRGKNYLYITFTTLAASHWMGTAVSCPGARVAGRETDYILPSSAAFAYTFTACCLIKLRGNFILFTIGWNVYCIYLQNMHKNRTRQNYWCPVAIFLKWNQPWGTIVPRTIFDDVIVKCNDKSFCYLLPEWRTNLMFIYILFHVA